LRTVFDGAVVHDDGSLPDHHHRIGDKARGHPGRGAA
jgi:hypothetical protein